MLEVFFPDIYVKSIYELPLESFKNKGIRALLFDIDNTIAPYFVEEPDEKTVTFFEKLKNMGFKPCLVSNNNEERVKRFNKKLNIFWISKANKPGTKKIRELLKHIGETVSSAAFIGDQAFTDVLCGKRSGMLTVLTRPVCDKDQFITRIKRGPERLLLNVYFKREGIER